MAAEDALVQHSLNSRQCCWDVEQIIAVGKASNAGDLLGQIEQKKHKMGNCVITSQVCETEALTLCLYLKP